MVVCATQPSTSYLLSAEGVSALKAAADTCEAATAFARNDVANAITEWWTQPAVSAVPWLKCRFRPFHSIAHDAMQSVLLPYMMQTATSMHIAPLF